MLSDLYQRDTGLELDPGMAQRPGKVSRLAVELGSTKDRDKSQEYRSQARWQQQ